MRIEDAKELLEDSIKPIVDKFCRSTGILRSPGVHIRHAMEHLRNSD